MSREDASAALAQDRHDAENEAAWSRIPADIDAPIAFALCLCRDGAHHHTETLGWLTTHEAAWSEHIYYPDDDDKPVHVIRRSVTVELDEPHPLAETFLAVLREHVYRDPAEVGYWTDDLPGLAEHIAETHARLLADVVGPLIENYRRGYGITSAAAAVQTGQPATVAVDEYRVRLMAQVAECKVARIAADEAKRAGIAS
jgi:hypothetical protein